MKSHTFRFGINRTGVLDTMSSNRTWFRSIRTAQNGFGFTVRLVLDDAHHKLVGQVRVRDHEGIARVELELEDLPMGIEHRETIVAGLKELGFSYVTMDLQGFRSGSMNEVLS